MSLKDIIAKVTALAAKVDASLREEVNAIKAQVDGALTEALAQVKDLTAKVTSLESTNAELSTQISGITAAASDRNKAELALRDSLLKHLSALPGHADYKEGGSKANAPLADLIAAEQNATNAAIASTGIKVEQLPAGGKAPEAATNKPANLTEACLKANKKA